MLSQQPHVGPGSAAGRGWRGAAGCAPLVAAGPGWLPAVGRLHATAGSVGCQIAGNQRWCGGGRPSSDDLAAAQRLRLVR
jgi:hypothetical protein